MSNDTRIAVIETTISNINTTLIEIKQDLKDNRHEIKQLSDKMDTRFDALQNRIWSNFIWLIGMMIGLAGLIAHTQHWL